MQIVKKLLFKWLLLLKTSKYNQYKPQKAHYVVKNIPYYSQSASRELVCDFITGKKDVQNDPKWKSTGADTKEEYAQWAWNGCGMACLQMILTKKLHKKIPFVALCKKCFTYGGYKIIEGALKTNDYKNYYDAYFINRFLCLSKKNSV